MSEAPPDCEFAPDEETSKRGALAREFYAAVFAPDDEPWFVSDEASLFDIWAGCDEAEIIGPCLKHYGVRLTREQFRWPFWRLLDHLQERRTSSQTR